MPEFINNYDYARFLYGCYLSSVVIGILFSRKFIATRINFFFIVTIPIILILRYGVPDYLLLHYPNLYLVYLFIFFPLVLYPFLTIVSFIISTIFVRFDSIRRLQALIQLKSILSKFLLMLTIHLFFNILSWFIADYTHDYGYLIDYRFFNRQYMLSIIVLLMLLIFLVYQLIIRKSFSNVKSILLYKNSDYWYLVIYFGLLSVLILMNSFGVSFFRLLLPL